MKIEAPFAGREDQAASGIAGGVRIVSLDVLRGFALCGILLVIVQPIAVRGGTVAVIETGEGWSTELLGLLAEQRFFPIFSLLFGIGFSLILRSAASRASHPRLLVLRRLVALLCIGLLHRLLWDGDILVIYAIVGLVVLLPTSWLPKLAVAGLSGVLLIAGFAAYGGGPAIVPGLFLLGSALTRYGVVDRFGGRVRDPAVVGSVLAIAAIAAIAWQLADPGPGLPLGIAGLLVGGTYVCGILALMATPFAIVLQRVFEPLGRMALTNYLSATASVLLIGSAIGHPEMCDLPVVLAVCGSVLLLQWACSTLWLHYFRQGPVEWLWRWCTWARRPQFRR